MGIGDIIAIIILSIILVPLGCVLLGLFLVVLTWAWPLVVVVIVILLIAGLCSGC